MTTEPVGTSPSRAGPELALWLAIAGILIAGIGFSWNPTPLAQGLAATFIACALVHAALSYSPRRALVLFVICITITFTMENLGAATGFPFGAYHFEVGAGLPSIGRIPIIVGRCGSAAAILPGSWPPSCSMAPTGGSIDPSMSLHCRSCRRSS